MTILNAVADGAWYFGCFVAVIAVLVCVHEYGHYLAARLLGIQVRTFSFGMGPPLLKRKAKSGTVWQVSALPIGGYVQFEGDEGAASAPSEESAQNPDSFHNRPVRHRALVVAAGPVANFLLAIALIAGMYAIKGQPFTPPVVSGVVEDTPAAEAGIPDGARIISVDGQEISRFAEVSKAVQFKGDQKVRLTYETPEGQVREVGLKPLVKTVPDGFGRTMKRAFIGVRFEGRGYRRLDPATAVYVATGESVSMGIMTFQALGEIVVGERSVDEVGGPVRIAEISGKAATYGFDVLVHIVALLSLNLGLVNLLPIPALDGGHLVGHAYEGAMGRKAPQKVANAAVKAGLALVLALMVGLTVNDVILLF